MIARQSNTTPRSGPLEPSLEKEAFNLYQEVRPEDGLEWWEISPRMRDYYRDLIVDSERALKAEGTVS